jgi:ABC-type nitrate/sulfonate/bicarbonate transport system substrate-binding protein
MIKLKLALDWTPNVNHIGFFVAKDLGFYEQKNISLEILNPLDDNYQMTPGKKLELDLADFSIAPFETVISLNNKENKVEAIAIFAILQEDLSCIVTLHNSGIKSPRQLDNLTYASYKARYEDHIVKQMVINDGGIGNLNLIYPDKLGIWNTILEENGDATWIFDNWEGIDAASRGIQLNKFKMADFRIPYGYSPVIFTKKQTLSESKNHCSAFIEASKEGFLYAKENPANSVEILKKYIPDYDLKNIDLHKSLAMTSSHFGDRSNCGFMKHERVSSFLNWLVENKLEDEKILQQNLYTNELNG